MHKPFLRWRTHSFEPLTGWHPRESTWIGKNTKTGRTAALLCVRSIPNKSDIRRVVGYVRNLLTDNPTPPFEIMIAVQDGITSTIMQLDGLDITIESEATLLNNLVDFEDYYREIERRVFKEQLPDSNLTIADVFVPPLVISRPDEIGSETESREDFQQKGQSDVAAVDLDTYVDIWLDETSNRQLALLGEYGQGKSTAALHIAQRLTIKSRAENIRVPILFELRGKSPKTLEPIELLGAWAAKYTIDPVALMKLATSGRLLLIFGLF